MEVKAVLLFILQAFTDDSPVESQRASPLTDV